MSIRITIQVTCDSTADAQQVISKLNMSDSAWPLQVSDDKRNAEILEKEEQLEKARNKAVKVSAPAETERANVSPGEPEIGKIGSGTAEFLLAEIRAKDREPTELGVKYIHHLRLLWKRNLVKYDGEVYYLD